MQNAHQKPQDHEWIPQELRGWLEREATGNGRTVEQEMLARLEESRQVDSAKKKP